MLNSTLKYIIIFYYLWYLAGAIITYNIEFYYWQNKFSLVADKDKWCDRFMASTCAIFWPADFIIIIINFKDYKKYGNRKSIVYDEGL